MREPEHTLVLGSVLARLLPENRLAFTFGRWIFCREMRVSIHTLRHELVHVAQFRRYGIPGFMVRYWWYNLRHGYQRNPLEVEARKGVVT